MLAYYASGEVLNFEIRVSVQLLVGLATALSARLASSIMHLVRICSASAFCEPLFGSVEPLRRQSSVEGSTLKHCHS